MLPWICQEIGGCDASALNPKSDAGVRPELRIDLSLVGHVLSIHFQGVLVIS